MTSFQKEQFGKYLLLDKIGAGGMATVYKAYDPDTDRYVALKVLPPHLSQDPSGNRELVKASSPAQPGAKYPFPKPWPARKAR